MQREELLRIKNLSVSIGDVEILHDINLVINKGETHVLMGPNGAGKSTLGYAMIGNPLYQVTSGEIWFKGQRIDDLPCYKRALEGMFLSFQNPIEIPGITLSSFIRSALEQRGIKLRLMQYKKELKNTMDILNIDESYADRDLNKGFSGGEKKKAEVLQMLMLNPSFAILDETDSGLDVDATKTVSLGIEEYRKKNDGSLFIITHNTKILQALSVDYTHIMVDGSLVKTSDASLIDDINANGFAQYEKDQ
ncbi:MAG: Fe-S cluster assembly ATPase SufC [Saccharofermentanaceae bacterium]|jgi:Fe-S cluster assembly ATP-binding protein|nr:Fe-S cluster assembly ATPase SufC [Clostridia bacterium]NLX68736.1 Fe-S cluster assembly ATPase SufC [Clostridiaceae bacterium]HOO48332.1 Fe-S cluster assembly ATPase SufC [Saccharofermentans sp.]HPE28118.1 Fe-S cluster assembly ATPase SufC [Saccharofermentans sp.]HPJ80993.1 Fe-S cluster assembly ATPase SufC [Saccharofermentans sp.]